MTELLDRMDKKLADSQSDVMNNGEIEERRGFRAKEKKMHTRMEVMRLGISISEAIMSPEFIRDE